MRRLLDRFDAMMAAVAFAEEGDAETARDIVRAAASRREAIDR
jgi:hypothetical protein